MPGATLIRAPPTDHTKSAIENVLELIPLSPIGPVRAISPLICVQILMDGAGYLYQREVH